MGHLKRSSTTGHLLRRTTAPKHLASTCPTTTPPCPTDCSTCPGTYTVTLTNCGISSGTYTVTQVGTTCEWLLGSGPSVALQLSCDNPSGHWTLAQTSGDLFDFGPNVTGCPPTGVTVPGNIHPLCTATLS